MSDGDDNILKLVDAETPPPDDGYRLQDQIGFILRRANQRHRRGAAARHGRGRSAFMDDLFGQHGDLADRKFRHGASQDWFSKR